MSENQRLNALLEKVAKLRALAARATTQAEAEAAAAQAEAIIAKYQIDEAQLESVNATAAEAIAEQAPLWQGQRRESWTCILAHGLSEDHGCAFVWYNHEHGSTYRIAGRPSDVAIVRYLFAWLTVEISRLSQREHGRSARNAFRIGAVDGFLATTRAARKQVQCAEKATGTAMVLADRHAQCLSFLKRAIGGRFVNATTHYRDRGAHDRGFASGSHLTEKHALGAGKTPMLGSGR